MDCRPAQKAWKAFRCTWDEWEAPNRLSITWPFILLGEVVFEEEDDPPDLLRYHTGVFSYRRQPLDILRTFLLYYLWSERCRSISTDNTPSRESYSNPGRPRPRWAWPPGRPLDLLARIGVRISN